MGKERAARNGSAEGQRAGGRRRDSLGQGEGERHTLRDVFESLIGSHDCDVESARISRPKPCLDLEILEKWMVG